MAAFILDRDDVRRFLTALPKDAEREKLERRLAKTHQEYQRCQHRRGEIQAAITSVSRELARKAEPELINRMSALMAEQAVWPMMLAEHAETYARALAAWSQSVWEAFDAIHRDAENAIAETATEANQLGRKLERLRIGDPEREHAREQLAAIHARNAPIAATRDVAHRGRASVQAYLNMVLAGHFVACQVSERDIDRFVERHASRKVAA